MSEREEGFLSGVEAAAQVCTDIADKHHKKYHEAAAGQPTHIAFGEWSGAQDCYLALAALTPPTDGAEALLRECKEILRLSSNHAVNVGDCDTCKLIDRIDA